jgi:hypothetical protein
MDGGFPGFRASDAEEIKNSELGAESWQLEAF